MIQPLITYSTAAMANDAAIYRTKVSSILFRTGMRSSSFPITEDITRKIRKPAMPLPFLPARTLADKITDRSAFTMKTIQLARRPKK